jgi:hypothetical protein
MAEDGAAVLVAGPGRRAQTGLAGDRRPEAESHDLSASRGRTIRLWPCPARCAVADEEVVRWRICSQDPVRTAKHRTQWSGGQYRRRRGPRLSIGSSSVSRGGFAPRRCGLAAPAGRASAAPVTASIAPASLEPSSASALQIGPGQVKNGGQAAQRPWPWRPFHSRLTPKTEVSMLQLLAAIVDAGGHPCVASCGSWP